MAKKKNNRKKSSRGPTTIGAPVFPSEPLTGAEESGGAVTDTGVDEAVSVEETQSDGEATPDFVNVETEEKQAASDSEAEDESEKDQGGDKELEVQGDMDQAVKEETEVVQVAKDEAVRNDTDADTDAKASTTALAEQREEAETKKKEVANALAEEKAKEEEKEVANALAEEKAKEEAETKEKAEEEAEADSATISARADKIAKAATAKAAEADAREAARYADGDQEVTVGFAKDAKKITVKTMFRDSEDGTKIRICKYGSGDQRLLIVHGAAEYVGRYGYVIDFFAKKGYEVTLVELRGHGMSQGERMLVKNWNEMVADVHTAAATIVGDCTVLCHSNGGLTMAYATTTDQVPGNVKKIVYSNPNVRNCSNALVRLVSWIPIKFTASAGFGPDMLSDSPDANEHYMNDDLIPKDLTSHYVKAMCRAQDAVHKVLGTKGRDMPCMFVFGSGDLIANPTKGQAWAQGQLELLGDDKCLIKVYDQLKHEMLHGLNRDMILNDIFSWLHK